MQQFSNWKIEFFEGMNAVGISWRLLSSYRPFPLSFLLLISIDHISHKLLTSQASWLSVQPRRADVFPNTFNRLKTESQLQGCQRQLLNSTMTLYMKPKRTREVSSASKSQKNKMASVLPKFSLYLFTCFFMLFLFFRFSAKLHSSVTWWVRKAFISILMDYDGTLGAVFTRWNSTNFSQLKEANADLLMSSCFISCESKKHIFASPQHKQPDGSYAAS